MAVFFRNTTDNHTIIDLIETVIGVLIIIVDIFLALAIVNLSGIVTTLLASAGIIGLALSFAFRDITSNFIVGVFISIHQPFSPKRSYNGYFQKKLKKRA